jgi:hypothetical protein
MLRDLRVLIEQFGNTVRDNGLRIFINPEDRFRIDASEALFPHLNFCIFVFFNILNPPPGPLPRRGGRPGINYLVLQLSLYFLI